jgi:hypothetical protein
MICSRSRSDDFGFLAREEEVMIIQDLQQKKK